MTSTNDEADIENKQLDEPVAEESVEEVVEELDEIEQLRQENGELKERIMRQQADFDNIRKRLRREMEEAGTRALVRFVRPLLVELDNFELAVNNANPEKFQDFAMGVSMTKNNIDGTLSSAGIEKVLCEGVFDPRWHEVVQEIERDDVGRGEIVEVLRTGYRIGDQIIRAAQVIVAKPPAEAAEVEATSEEE